MSGLYISIPGAMRSRALLGAAFAVAALPVSLPAQDEGAGGSQVGEIIVTAQHREENLQQVPISVSALSADTLAESGVSATSAIAQAVPAVQFTRSGPVGLFFLRGVGTSNGAAGEEGSNVFYVDGVYMPDQFQSIVNFNNIERVEVLKGPQGTLFGRNAFGGLVHMITRDPSDGLQMNAKAGYGKYETTNGQFYAGGPLTDTFAMDIALTGQHQGEGWGRNLTRNEDIKEEKYWGARSKAVYEPTDTLKFTLSGDYYELEDDSALTWRIADGFTGFGGVGSPGGWDTTANDPSWTHLRTSGVSLTVEADLGFATLTSITAERQTDNHSDFDADAGPSSLVRINYLSGTRSLQQELRLASNETDPLSWQAGTFWLRSKVDVDSRITGAQAQTIVDELITDSWAVFGEVTYAITPATFLTGGIRRTEDVRSFDVTRNDVTLPGPITISNTMQDNLRYDEATYRIALRHDFTDDLSIYTSWNRGFKAGTYNMQAPFVRSGVTLIPSNPVEPMFIDAYEAGVKSQWFDRRLRLNIAAYHYDIDDYQVRIPVATIPGASELRNAAKVEVDGIDVEFEAAPMDNLSVYGGFTFLDAEYDRFRNGPVYIFPGTGGVGTTIGDVSGNETAMAPDFSGSLGFTYTVPVGDAREVRLSALYNYNSGYYFDPDESSHQDGYHVFNASAEYVLNDNWSVSLWGRNLTDDEYRAQMSAVQTGMAEVLAPPRTYGVSVEYNY